MAAVTICSDFEAQKNKVWHCFYLFPMKWWDRMPWSSFSECWDLSQLFHSPLSLSLAISNLLVSPPLSFPFICCFLILSVLLKNKQTKNLHSHFVWSVVINLYFQVFFAYFFSSVSFCNWSSQISPYFL